MSLDIRTYRKKPVTVQAVPVTDENTDDVCRWIEEAGGQVLVTATLDLLVVTPEGNMHFGPGDWIIRGVIGEFYPCKASVFDATYESAGDQPSHAPVATIELLVAEVGRLRELAEELLGYVPDYFRKKWRFDEQLQEGAGFLDQ